MPVFRFLASGCTRMFYAGLLLLVGVSPIVAQTLAEIGNETISLKEFDEQYRKTYNAAPSSASDALKYLDLLVNFKIKLKEAQAANVPSDPDVVAEINDYRNDVAISYLLEKKLAEPGARILYDRRMTELELWQIFLRFKKDKDGTIDTADAFERANDIIRELKTSPLPFDSLVMKYSEDPSKDKNRGKLGWWIAGIGYPTVDDAVYQMKKGEVSSYPVRTMFGYHIFKVTERRPALQRVRGSHILYRLDVQNPLDTSAAYARLSLILDSLKRGTATFEELARRNSHDPVSGADGGDLGWMDRGALEETFEQYLLQLKPGEISPIVRTKFGMHLIKKMADGEPLPFEDTKQRLITIYKKERFDAEADAYIEKLLGKYHFTPSPDVKKLLLSRLPEGTTTSTPDWWKSLRQQDLNAYLFKIDGKPVTIGYAVKEITSSPELQMRRFTPEGLDSIVTMLGTHEAFIIESAPLEKEYPEFNRLMDEYKSGVYISALENRIMNEKTQIAEDELRQYWERHKDEYTFPNRVEFKEILLYGEEFAKKILDSLKAGVSFDKLQGLHSRRTGVNSKGGNWDMVPYDYNELSREAWKMEPGKISELIQTKMGFSVIKTVQKESARVKTFDEAKSEATARLKEKKIDDYKKQWMKELRDKYQVRIHEDEISEAIGGNAK